MIAPVRLFLIAVAGVLLLATVTLGVIAGIGGEEVTSTPTPADSFLWERVRDVIALPPTDVLQLQVQGSLLLDSAANLFVFEQAEGADLWTVQVIDEKSRWAVVLDDPTCRFILEHSQSETRRLEVVCDAR